MNNFLKTICFLALIFIIFSCGRKAFPDDRFIFSSKFRSLITPYRIGDTLKFINSSLETHRIVITGKDSIITNRKGGFMSQRPYKLVQLYCNTLDYRKKNARDTSFIFINKYPDNMKESCYFSLMNFRGSITNQNDSIISNFQTQEGQTFSNCFVVSNVALDLMESKDDIEHIYVQLEKGIIAFRSYRGDLWVKQE